MAAFNFHSSKKCNFIKKVAKIDTSLIKTNFLTEAGITSNNEDFNNPTIYNYYSFINENNPNGIDISSGDLLTISVYIYLNLTNASVGLFTRLPIASVRALVAALTAS